jgi:hypothetical protein
MGKEHVCSSFCRVRRERFGCVFIILPPFFIIDVG